MNGREISVLAELSVLAALGEHRSLHDFAERDDFRAIPLRKVSEALLEVHLFAGFPAAIEAFSVLKKKVAFGPKKSSVPLYLRRRLGERACRKVYGRKYETLMARMRDLSPDLSEWIVEDGYGKVLSRPGLALIERELIAVAVLAALGWTRQLRSHVEGSFNVGATEKDLRAVVKSVTPHLSRSELETVTGLIHARRKERRVRKQKKT